MKRILASLLLISLLAAPASAQTADPAATPVPANTVKMVQKSRAMLEHYWNAHFEALEWRREFKPVDAWDNAAKAAGFSEHSDFLSQAQLLAKNDPVHFPRLLNELRRELETAYRDRLARRIAQAAATEAGR